MSVLSRKIGEKEKKRGLAGKGETGNWIWVYVKDFSVNPNDFFLSFESFLWALYRLYKEKVYIIWILGIEPFRQKLT